METLIQGPFTRHNDNDNVKNNNNYNDNDNETKFIFIRIKWNFNELKKLQFALRDFSLYIDHTQIANFIQNGHKWP